MAEWFSLNENHSAISISGGDFIEGEVADPMCSLTLRLSNRHGKWTFFHIPGPMSRSNLVPVSGNVCCIREHDISGNRTHGTAESCIATMDYIVHISMTERRQEGA